MELTRISPHLLYVRFNDRMFDVVKIDVAKEKIFVTDNITILELDYNSKVELFAITDKE
jgi:hypothetical protein